MDIYWYSRLRCCILSAAETVLEHAGLPLPERRGFYDFGAKGQPVCCDSLLVSSGASRPITNPQRTNTDCGPVPRDVFYDVRIFRDVCQQPPECDDVLEDCSDLLGCPGQKFEPVEGDPCSPVSRAYSQMLLDADRQALERMLPAQINACLCEPDDRCPDGCDVRCDVVWWADTKVESGGGCAGSIIRVGVRAVG